jgi:Peptidase_C39 like family
MRRLLIIFSFVICLIVVAAPPASQAIDAELSISPVVQRTPVWCWVAVGEMVFEHFNVPNVNPAAEYQCGIIGALAGPLHPCWSDCRRCIVPAGSPGNITNMLLQYPRVAGQLTRQSIRGVRSRHAGRALTVDEIKEELDNDRPIIAGINPSGVAGPFAQHVALVIGYEEDGEVLILIVNDPYPYQYVGNRFDPFLRANGRGGQGQYRIAYDNFRRGLAWSESVYDLRQ